MTLVVTVNGPDSIWMVADRRLSYSNRPPKDDARKIAFLETQDGIAILGYAGLGASSLGTEPSSWMSAVLRGRKLPLEDCLGTLADAVKRQFPRHLAQLPQPVHTMVIPAFVGEEARLYTIDLALAPNRKDYAFRYSVCVAEAKKPPRLTIAGSGSSYLAKADDAWMRDLLRVVKAHDRGLISTLTVADRLAHLNNAAHIGTQDQSVGARSIVAWRHRKNGVHKGGGGHQCYTGTARDDKSPALPTIANGLDVCALVSKLMPFAIKELDSMTTDNEPESFANEEIDAALADLPTQPDEHLR